MGNYSLVERRTIIPYDTIEEQYVVTGNLSYLLLFLFLYIQKTAKKGVNTDFRLYKPVKIAANTKREFNIRTRKFKKMWVNGRIKAIPPT